MFDSHRRDTDDLLRTQIILTDGHLSDWTILIKIYYFSVCCVTASNYCKMLLLYLFYICDAIKIAVMWTILRSDNQNIDSIESDVP